MEYKWEDGRLIRKTTGVHHHDVVEISVVVGDRRRAGGTAIVEKTVSVAVMSFLTFLSARTWMRPIIDQHGRDFSSPSLWLLYCHCIQEPF